MTSAITPVGLLDSDQVKSVLGAAVLAPSTHNTQPWRFRCTPVGLELHADTERALPVVDAGRRELLLSCGAALFNLRTAIHALGAHPATTLLPRRDEPDLLAVVRPFAARKPDPRLVELAGAIPRRHTNRTPFEKAAIPPSVVTRLRHAAEVEQAWLPRLDAVQLARLRELVNKSHHAQLADPAFVAEWRYWTGRGRGSRDGVPDHAAGAMPADDGGWILRDFGTEPSPRRGRIDASDPLVVVIGSFDDTRLDQLRAGQAMQRVLLTATAAGLDASFISQPVEVGSVRGELRDLLGGGLWPQIVLRLGRGKPVAWTPRRSVADVLLEPDRLSA
ncbi:Acg family FMN-binding oxidoreductase [Amycolatopsis tolypomycina]|uniref:Nitroreductase family protein n=1 Tax=Amycolatopsis tolypomycina TaxID=208445 RepID=A0A1H4U191_9PSEU|nr:nitroreductase family protein [Amycolatopsis tolypomycina]SEC62300.1 Nitroreductase family protein [Amycolatopsis tolypomycina]